MPEGPKAGLRLAVYARVSTEEQREGQTIDSQVAELERFAMDKHWQIAGIYKDEGWSGGVMARPELDHLRDDASKGVFDAVLINDVDRLARDVAHLGVIKRDLERRRIQVIFRKLPVENTPTSNLMVNILGSFAEFERELIADRTRRGRKHKVEVRKQFLGSIAPYGFRYLPRDVAAGKEGLLELVPKEAAVVRQMYSWVTSEGLSARKVMARLNAMGIRPRKGAQSWQKSSVLRILRSEVYAGVWYYNKSESYESDTDRRRYRKLVKNGHRRRPKEDWIALQLPSSLRIIERSQWEKVQRQLDKNIAFSPRNSKHAYLLGGLLQCNGCQAAYVGNPSHGKFYYRCSKRCKRYPTVQETTLNEVVWSAVEEVILNPKLIVDQITRRRETEAAVASKVGTEKEQIAEDLRQIEVEESRILEAYRTGVITAAQLGRELEQINARKSGLLTRQAELDEKTEGLSLDEIRESVFDYCKQVAQRIGSFSEDERRQLLRTLVGKVVFEGSQVMILGTVPRRPPEQSSPLAVGRIVEAAGRDLLVQAVGGIATTEVYLRVPNPAMEFALVKPISRRRQNPIPREKLNPISDLSAVCG